MGHWEQGYKRCTAPARDAAEWPHASLSIAPPFFLHNPTHTQHHRKHPGDANGARRLLGEGGATSRR